MSIDAQHIQKAMQAHASQYVWFRRLYVLWSRYLFINTFLPIDMD
jgi:N-acetylglucosaminylphosphatidylinositol deacetylase